MPLEPGLTGRVDHVVGPDDLATVLGSGTVEVLATPRVLAWLEAACVAAVGTSLAPGETTVGMRAQFDHVHASVVGARVVSTAELERVEGRRLTFAVTAVEDIAAGDGPAGPEIALGHLTRVIVDSARFLERAGAQPTTSQ